MCILAIKMIT